MSVLPVGDLIRVWVLKLGAARQQDVVHLVPAHGAVLSLSRSRRYWNRRIRRNPAALVRESQAKDMASSGALGPSQPARRHGQRSVYVAGGFGGEQRAAPGLGHEIGGESGSRTPVAGVEQRAAAVGGL